MYYLLNDPWLHRHDVYVRVKVDELAHQQYRNQSKMVPGAEPSQMQHLMQR